MAPPVTDLSYHLTRFRPTPDREVLWATLCASFFQQLIEPDFHVLDLGAGYGNFINNVRCARRTAVDRWAALAEHVQPGVTARIGEVTDLSFLEDASVDFVFASNLFEHLTQAEFATVLAQLRRKARPGRNVEHPAAELPPGLPRGTSTITRTSPSIPT